LKNSYYDSLIVVPFIELLKSLVKIGADPKATVDKLEFYRELDKHKQHLMLVQDQREGLNVVQDAVMQGEVMIDTGANESIQPVHVKNRNEVLAGQKFEKAHQKSTKSKKEKGNEDPEKQKKKAMQAKVKEFYASKGVSPAFHKVNGK
jgi:hypothetical protein